MWPQISSTQVLSVEVFDSDLVGDEELGRLDFDIGARLRELPLDCRDATWQQAFPLEKARPPAGAPASASPWLSHSRPPISPCNKSTLKPQSNALPIVCTLARLFNHVFV